MRVGLVGCVKTKLDHAAPAQDLYVSTLFRGRRAFVEVSCDQWFVLSAKHGVVSPAEIVEPYEETLNGKPLDAKRSWAASVLQQLDGNDIGFTDTVFEIHAGAEYRDFGLVDGLQSRGATVQVPAAHLGQGEQLAFYAGRSAVTAQTLRRPTTVTPAPSSPGAARSSYAPLAGYLQAAEPSFVQLSFPQIERILSRPLPASARRHRAWWSNESRGTHSQAAAWMGVGQAGATQWPSGKRSQATLASRIGQQHIRGNTRSSTFRLTISVLLLNRLGLVPANGGKLDPRSNGLVSGWIAEHLRVVIAPLDDRDRLGAVEAEVVAQLDPPLNLGHCLPSEARTRLTALRRSLPRR
ncbi:MAG: hypothetical protein H0W56_05250 [Acidothermales bacterium]|nr:hypothetical protein [Acidothermales bacterium]